jgi:hypothetical protein
LVSVRRGRSMAGECEIDGRVVSLHCWLMMVLVRNLEVDELRNWVLRVPFEGYSVSLLPLGGVDD